MKVRSRLEVWQQACGSMKAVICNGQNHMDVSTQFWKPSIGYVHKVHENHGWMSEFFWVMQETRFFVIDVPCLVQ